MRTILAVFTLALSTTLFAQGVPPHNREDDPEYKKEREEWIRQMHRAEPGVDPAIINAETRLSKALARMQKRHSGQSQQSKEADTVADGRITGEWSERGSNNIAGRMHICDVDWDKGVVYAASSYGNVWKGNLDGTDWQSLNDAWRFRDIRSVKVIRNGNNVRILIVANGPAAVYYSDNEGQTWKMSTGLDAPKAWGYFRKAQYSYFGDTVYVLGAEWDYSTQNWGASGILYRSIDRGKTFVNMIRGKFSVDRTDIWTSPYKHTPLYIVKEDTIGIVRSDGQIELIARHAFADSATGYFTLQGASTFDTPLLYLLSIHNGKSFVHSSIDAGVTWHERGAYDGTPFDRNNSFCVSEKNPNTLFIGGVNIFRSDDAGNFWIQRSQWGEYYGDPETKLHADIDGIQTLQDPFGDEYTFISTDGGLYTSTDGLENVKNIMLTGVGTSQYYDVLTSTSETPFHIYSGSQDQGFQKGVDTASGVLDFKQTISGDYGHLTSSDKGASVWSNYPGFSMYYPAARTSDHQRGWNFPKGANRNWIPPMIADPDEPTVAYTAAGDTTASVIWKLRYGSDSVSREPLTFDFSGGNKDWRVSAISISPIDHNYWYVLTNDGRFYHSSDRGSTWIVTDSATGVSGHYFYGANILPSEVNLGEVTIAGSGYSNPGVYHSFDHGASFIRADSGLPKTLVYSLAGTPDGEFLFAGTDVGPYVYSKEAKRWFDMAADKAPDMVYWSCEYVPEIKTVRFGTHGRGIWDFAIEQFKSAANHAVTDPLRSHSLRSEYHTNGDIQLSFDLLRGDNLRLRIFDISGKMVAELCNGSLPLGHHSFLWKPTNGLPSGIYLVTLSSSMKTDFIKVQLTH